MTDRRITAIVLVAMLVASGLSLPGVAGDERATGTTTDIASLPLQDDTDTNESSANESTGPATEPEFNTGAGHATDVPERPERGPPNLPTRSELNDRSRTSSNGSIDPAVLDSTGTVEVVVRFEEVGERPDAGRASVAALKERATATQRPFERYAERNPAISVERSFWIANAKLVTVDTDELSVEELTNVPHVDRVHANFEVKATETATTQSDGFAHGPGTQPAIGQVATQASGNYTYGLEMVNAPEVWNQFGARGEGVNVTVLDTGVDPDHPDLSVDQWAEFDSSGNLVTSSTPHAAGDHGSHVAGTIVGGNASGTHIGVAPEATHHHGLVIPNGAGTFAQVAAGMEWAVDDVETDVLSMSLGANGYHQELIEPVQNAEQNGVLVVAAIGNAGEGITGSPGNVYDVLAVGAVDDEEDVASFSGGETIDTASAWGAAAPAHWPAQYTTPDVSAPGVSVYSSVPDGGYAQFSGTSMATPHVSGVAALVLSADDSNVVDPSTVDDVIVSTARAPDDSFEPDHRYGQGIVDARGAVAVVTADTTLNGTVVDPSGDPVADAVVETEYGLSATTNTSGYYELTIPSEEQTVTADALGFEPERAEVNATDVDWVRQDFTVTNPIVDVEILEGQPVYATPADDVEVTIQTANVQNLTVAFDGDRYASAAETSLTVEGQSVAYGERIDVSASERVTTVNVSLDAEEGYFGGVALEYTFENGTDGETVRTGPTTLHEPTVTVGAGGDVDPDTLQDVVDRVKAGTTVELEAGTYEEQTRSSNSYGAALEIDRPLTLTAEDGATATIAIDDVAGGFDGVTITSPEVTLANLSIDGDGITYVVASAGNAVTIENSSLSNGLVGVLVWSGTANAIRGNEIGDVDLGVAVWTGADVVEDNAIGTNGAVEWGILTEGVVEQIHGNEVDAAGSGVILHRGSSTGALTENTVTTAWNESVLVRSTADVERITGNDVTGGSDGIVVWGETNEVSNNRVRDVTGRAIDVTEVESMSIRENHVENATWGGITLAKGTDVDIVDNTLTDVAHETGAVGAISVSTSTSTTIAGNVMSGDMLAVVVSNETHLVDNEVSDGNTGLFLLGARDTVVERTRFTNVSTVLHEFPHSSNTTVETATIADPDGRLLFQNEDRNEIEVKNLTLVDGTTVDVTGQNATFALGASPDDPPADLASLGTYFEMNDVGDDPAIDLDVHYDAADVSGVENDTVALYRYDDGSWSEAGSSTFTDGTLSATDVTQFSTFGAFGEESAPPSVTDQRLVDVADDDGVVDDEDEIRVVANVSEGDYNVTSVEANLSAFGAGVITLTDENSDGEYNATATVDASAPGVTEGEHDATVTAEDERGATTSVATNALVLDTSPPQNPTGTTIVTDPITAANEGSVEVDVSFASQPEEGTVEVRLNGSGGGTATGSAETASSDTVTVPVDASGLADGNVTAESRIVDRAGNENPDGFTAESNPAFKDATPPTISAFDASNPSGQVLRVSFESSEELASVAVEASGPTAIALDETDFVSDGPTYVASRTVSENGSYDVSLVSARDGVGNDGANGHGETVTVGTVEEAAAAGGGGGGDLEPPGTAIIDVTDATVDETTVLPGERVTVTVTLENSGDGDGTTTIELVANGEVVADERVFVPEFSTRTYELYHSFDDTGEYDLAVEGTSAGTVEVVNELPDDGGTPTATESDEAGGAPGPTETSTPTDEGGQAVERGGLDASMFLLVGVGVAIVAGVAFFLRRR